MGIPAESAVTFSLWKMVARVCRALWLLLVSAKHLTAWSVLVRLLKAARLHLLLLLLLWIPIIGWVVKGAFSRFQVSAFESEPASFLTASWRRFKTESWLLRLPPLRMEKGALSLRSLEALISKITGPLTNRKIWLLLLLLPANWLLRRAKRILLVWKATSIHRLWLLRIALRFVIILTVIAVLALSSFWPRITNGFLWLVTEASSLFVVILLLWLILWRTLLPLILHINYLLYLNRKK